MASATRTGKAMKLLLNVRERSNTRTMQDRLVWQSASLLLAYPDDGLTERLDTVDEMLSHIGGPAADLLNGRSRRCVPATRWPPRLTTSRPSTCGGAARCT